MIPTLKDFISLLEELSPQEYAESWDNSGFQVGANSCEIRKVFMALDPTIASLKSASSRGAQLLLTHHPLIFKPISKIDYERYPGSVIYQAAKEDICIVAAHTNLDVGEGGINDMLAEILNLYDLKVLDEVDGVESIGLGRIGRLPVALSLNEVVKIIKKVFRLDTLKISGEEKSPIRTVAVVGGSGGSLINSAFRNGADLLITGDVDHHQALEAVELGIVVVDGGHFNMEKKAFSLFSERLREVITARGWNVTIEFDLDEEGPTRWG
ncbi:Nif3-like dinuclear metal center hexameric protein [Thermodesulfobacteriota bacterium]